MNTTMRDTTSEERPRERAAAQVSGWALFAGMVLLLAGSFNVIFGLTAMFRGHVFVLVSPGLIVGSLTGWGVVHFILGAAMVVVSMGLFSGQGWARWIAVWLAALNAVGQVAFITVFPLWSLLVVALDILVIYNLTAHWEEQAAE